MMRVWGFCFVLFVLLASAPQLASSSGTRGRASAVSQEMNFTLEGRISKLSPGKLTVSGEGNIIFRVAYTDKTEIKRKDGSAGSANDLKVGLTVRVEGDLAESGEIAALKIQVLAETTPK